MASPKCSDRKLRIYRMLPINFFFLVSHIQWSLTMFQSTGRVGMFMYTRQAVVTCFAEFARSVAFGGKSMTIRTNVQDARSILSP